MKATITKLGQSTFAILLAGFVCLSPSGLSAYAEGEDTATQPITDAQPDSTGTYEAVDAANDAIATSDQADTAQPVAEPSADSSADAATASDPGTDGAADEAQVDDATTQVEPNIFNIGSCLELMDAYKYDINSQSGQSFTINLTDDITLVKPTDRMDTHGKRLVVGTDRLYVKNGNTVTILGHGHTISYADKSITNLSLGATANSALILGSPAGGDALTVTFSGTSNEIPLVTVTAGATVTMNDGVTLSNNVNTTGLAGGAVCVQSGGTFNMKGGTIDNCTNAVIPFGGGVAVEGGTFNMTGGKITGCHEAYAQGRDAEGGGVVIGANGGADAFNMSGNAVIENCSSSMGGGVCVGPNATFAMSGNASIKNCTATTNGGGVYVSQAGTFTMGEGNSITGCNASFGGGVMNFGTATVTNVYGNDASSAGADIYNDGTITMDDVKADWSLSREQSTSDPDYVPGSEASDPTDGSEKLGGGIGFQSARVTTMAAEADESTESGTTINPSSKDIDGWYYDGHRETGETDADGNAVVERNRWNANEDTADVPQYLKSYVVTGQPTTETMGLMAAHSPKAVTPDDPETPVEPDVPDTIDVIWENYDGTVLFELDKVDAEHIPAAEEYNALSGNEDPTEPSDSKYDYEFEGWQRMDEPNGDVVYIAMYTETPEGNTDDPSDPTDPTDPVDPSDPTEPTDPENPADPTEPVVPTIHEDQPIVPVATPDDGVAPATEAEHASEQPDGVLGSLVAAGDNALMLVVGLGGIALVAAGVIVLARRRSAKD